MTLNPKMTYLRQQDTSLVSLILRRLFWFWGWAPEGIFAPRSPPEPLVIYTAFCLPLQNKLWKVQNDHSDHMIPLPPPPYLCPVFGLPLWWKIQKGHIGRISVFLPTALNWVELDLAQVSIFYWFSWFHHWLAEKNRIFLLPGGQAAILFLRASAVFFTWAKQLQ